MKNPLQKFGPGFPSLRKTFHLFLVCITLTACYGCSADDWSFNWLSPRSAVVPEPLPPLAVSAIEMQQAEVAPRIHAYVGTIKPERVVTLSFSRSGMIENVEVEMGDLVQAGQSLALLDSKPLKEKKNELELSLRQLRSELAEKTGNSAANQQDQRTRIRRLRQDLARLETDLNTPSGSTEGDELVKRLKSMEHELAALKFGDNDRQRSQINARIAEVEGNLRRTNSEIRAGAIEAPFTGVIAGKLAEKGEVVSPGLPVLSLVSASHVAVVSVPIEVAAQATPEQPLSVTVRGQKFTGMVEQISPQLDPRRPTQTVVVKISSSPKSNQLIPGESALITFSIQSNQTGYWLPLSALHRDFRDRWSVFVLDEFSDTEARVVVQRSINVLVVEEDRAFVEGGIQPGELVVPDGIHRLTAGQRVRLVKKELNASGESETPQ